jgi:hypothetical protein
MKKLLLLLFSSVILFSFSSCDKDDPKPDPIIGTWTADKVTISNLPEKYKVYEGSVVPQALGIISYTYVFKSDKDKTVEVEIRDGSGSIFEQSGTWSATNNVYTVDLDNASSTYELKLEDEKLAEVNEGIELDLEDPNDENVVETVTCTFTYYFKKSV